MKKLFYSLLLVVITAVSLSSCTEENVKPMDGPPGTGGTGGGGGSIDPEPPRKP